MVIADDHRTFTDALRTYLEHRDGLLVVGTAYNGDDAIELAGDADVVLVDLHMPSSAGVDTIKRLRAVHPDVRAVAMSGLAELGDEAHAAGACAFLCKRDIHSHVLDVIHAVAATPQVVR